MKALFGVGLIVLILGIASFFIPLPQKENHGIKVGDTSIGVQTQHSEKVPPVISAVLVVGGVGMLIAGAGKK